MNYLKVIGLLFFTFMTIAGCGKEKKEEKDDSANNSIPSGIAAGIKNRHGDVIGYFLGFANDPTFRYSKPVASSYAYILLKNPEVLVIVCLETGEYLSERVAYVSDANCSGNSVYSMNGVMANQVIHVSGLGYYKSSGSIQSLTPTSCRDKNGCAITDGCISSSLSGMSLASTSKPYDFSELAPITISALKP